jgi:hypothetical protein
MEERLARFIVSLYFDTQRIDGVKSLEIWNGIRERNDPLEKCLLVKNLFKIVVPLVNGEFFARPLPTHGLAAKAVVASLLEGYRTTLHTPLFERFPNPPVGDEDQKELYLSVKEEAARSLREAVDRGAAGSKTVGSAAGRTAAEDRAVKGRGKAGRAAGGRAKPRRAPSRASPKDFPDGVFDLREMRVIDNELPYIIFTDKEFRVIHGMVIAYLRLIDLDSVFLETLAQNGVGAEIMDGYRSIAADVQGMNPLMSQGRQTGSRSFASRLKEKLKSKDYLDVFEAIYVGFEEARKKLGG